MNRNRFGALPFALPPGTHVITFDCLASETCCCCLGSVDARRRALNFTERPKAVGQLISTMICIEWESEPVSIHPVSIHAALHFCRRSKSVSSECMKHFLIVITGTKIDPTSTRARPDPPSSAASPGPSEFSARFSGSLRANPPSCPIDLESRPARREPTAEALPTASNRVADRRHSSERVFSKPPKPCAHATCRRSSRSSLAAAAASPPLEVAPLPAPVLLPATRSNS